MKTLILPVAGSSSRFPGMRPKWLLTMPDGKLMVEKAVENLDMSDYDKVVVVCRAEHLKEYLTDASLAAILEGIGHPEVEVCALQASTSCQSETVAVALRQAGVEGAFFVKDCDNKFHVRWGGGNEVAVVDLHKFGLVDAKSKSYVGVDGLGYITNIVEKEVISSYFCCGGYGFDSAEAFLCHFDSIKSNEEVYISHVIYSMLMDGKESFRVNQAEHYVDWGTLREFRHYTRSFMTVFCDVDGVLLYNGSKFGKAGWRTEPIIENLAAIARLQSAGLLHLIITSSRPESEVQYLSERLAEFNVYPDHYVMALPHTQRILVNDYSLTNPFPAAMSVNLERDSTLLSSILESIND